MSPLVKKEIRLLLPAAIVALLLALPAFVTRRDDPFPIYLLFVGMVMMALSTFGRETSLNTFSSLLAQPAERTKIWQTKLSVLFAAFIIVSLVWFLGEFAARPGEPDAASAVFYSGPFVVVATFTGGLWTTLLLRQLAGAFWLTLLVPVVLASVAGGILSYTFTDSVSAIYVGLAVLLLLYSLGGFFFARSLFFRAQDIGWTGGAIDLSALSFGSRAESTETGRRRRPFRNLLKKEIRLQSASLVCAAVLLVFHLSVIAFRHFHHFQPESAGDVLTSLVWMIWLVFPLFISCLAIAEERRLGVMESQLCLPVSRRLQFAIKAGFTLSLGVFLGGILPGILESLGNNTVLRGAALNILLYLLCFGGWLGVAGFFGSSLARNFLQAIGYSIATVVLCSLTLSAFMGDRMFGPYLMARTVLTILIAGPVMVLTLLRLSWLNFKNFREGWPLWRRSLVSFVTAIVFIAVASPAIHNRVWEIVLPDEPSHGVARLSLQHPGVELQNRWNDLLARLPDGRVWFANYHFQSGFLSGTFNWSMADTHFVAGSNWLSVATGYRDFSLADRAGKSPPPHDPHDHVTGYRDVVGIRNDGTLWLSDASPTGAWMGDHMRPYGTETNWRQVVCHHDGVALLKTDGTLWFWGQRAFNWTNWETHWPSLHDYQPVPFGTDTNWASLHPEINWARKSDGSVWWYDWNPRNDRPPFGHDTNLAAMFYGSGNIGGQNTTYVDATGKLWADLSYWYTSGANKSAIANRLIKTGGLQMGNDSDWTASAATWDRLFALKADGTLWKWNLSLKSADNIFSLTNAPPERASNHSDWIGIVPNNNDSWEIIALAADGSLWAWPDPQRYGDQTLIKPSKRPHYLGNIFVASN